MRQVLAEQSVGRTCADAFPAAARQGRAVHPVGIDLFSGRSPEAKRAIYRGVVAGLAAVGVPVEDVTIRLNEIGRENWGIRGGRMATDVDLGFKVEV